jgi:hypothetical protein
MIKQTDQIRDEDGWLVDFEWLREWVVIGNHRVEKLHSREVE